MIGRIDPKMAEIRSNGKNIAVGGSIKIECHLSKNNLSREPVFLGGQQERFNLIVLRLTAYKNGLFFGG